MVKDLVAQCFHAWVKMIFDKNFITLQQPVKFRQNLHGQTSCKSARFVLDERQTYSRGKYLKYASPYDISTQVHNVCIAYLSSLSSKFIHKLLHRGTHTKTYPSWALSVPLSPAAVLWLGYVTTMGDTPNVAST